MTQMMGILLALAAGAAFFFIGLYVESRRLRGKRLVTCPENQQPAGVEFGRDRDHLASCSRWPERAGCGQQCIHQIQTAPDGCRVSSLVERWYHGKRCAICNERVDDSKWQQHGPALIRKDRTLVDWNEVPVEKLTETLEQCHALCFRCHTVELFRQTQAQLVTDRSEFR